MIAAGKENWGVWKLQPLMSLKNEMGKENKIEYASFPKIVELLMIHILVKDFPN